MAPQESELPPDVALPPDVVQPPDVELPLGEPDGSEPGVWVAPTLRADLLSWGLAALWGGSPAAVKLSLEHGHPMRLALLRLLIAVLTMIAADRIMGVRLRPTRREAAYLGALGLLLAGHTAASYYGHDLTSVGHASALLGSNPIFAMLLAHFFIAGDRLNLRGVLGAVIVYAGVLTLFSQHFAGEGETLLGDLLMIIASLTIAVRQISVARLTQWIHPVKVVFWETLAATPIFVVAAIVIETDRWTWHWELLIALLYQGFLMFGLGLFLNTHLMQRYMPSRILATQMMIPLFGVVFGWALFGEPIGWELAVAVALVVIGVLVSPRWPLPMRSHPPAEAEEAEEEAEDAAELPPFSFYEEPRPAEDSGDEE